MLEREHGYLKELLEYPTESKRVDYKSAVSFDEKTDFAAKLVKHTLGIANSGGGYLVIGYKEQTDKRLAPDPGTTDEIVASYEVTRLCQYVEKYLLGQDRIEIQIYKEEFGGVRYPIISVARFQEYPFVCTKDYISPATGEAILESGQIYIRTEGARTLTVKSPSEWRQLIKECIKARQEMEAKRPTEIGEEEEVKAVEIPRGAEKPVSIEKRPQLVEKAEEAEKQFSLWAKKEIGNAMREMESAGFDKGFFKFLIRVPWGLDQIDNTTLLEIAQKSECHNTGWPIGVVILRPEYTPVPLIDGIRAVMNTGDGFDYWVINNRGHFFFMRNHSEDTDPKISAKGDKILFFDVTIWRLSEVISYASNLCNELNLDQKDKIKLNLSYEGLKDRILSVANPLRVPFIHAVQCKEDRYEIDLKFQTGDLLPKLKDHVYQIAKGLFGLFEFYRPDRAVVDSIVDEFLRSRT